MGRRFFDREMAPIGYAYSLVGGPCKREYPPVVRRRAGARQEAEDKGSGVGLLLPARHSSEPPSALFRHHLFRQLHSCRYARRHRQASTKTVITPDIA